MTLAGCPVPAVLRTRQAGRRTFADFHLLVDGGTTVRDGHALAHHVEEKLRADFGELEVTVHIEPIEDRESWEEAELRRLFALCSTGECRQSVGGWSRDAKAPVRIEIASFFDEVRISVAQYMATGEVSLRAKLAQFPAGTTFRLAEVRSEEAKLMRSRVEAAVRDAGHRMVP